MTLHRLRRRVFAIPLRASTMYHGRGHAVTPSLAARPSRSPDIEGGSDQMNPGGGLITMANSRFTDPAFRDLIRAMHANQVPLVDMVVELGLADEMSAAVRTVVEQLGPDDVAAIRQAILDMLDRAENVMPVDCNLSQGAIDQGAPVDVSIVPEDGRSTIRVRRVRTNGT